MYTRNELSSMAEAELATVAHSLNLKFNPDAVTASSLIDLILGKTEAAPKKRRSRSSVKPAKVTDLTKGEKTNEKKFRIIVHNQEGVESSPFVKVQPQGRMYAIPREKEVIVPEIVVKVLEDAVLTRYVPTGDGTAMTPISQRRFPFTVLGPA